MLLLFQNVFKMSTFQRPDGEDCVVVQGFTENVAAIGTWDHAACNEKKPYLCQALRGTT